MHKLAKGLKKKKKGKKSKHKEEELFKPEELEAYRREHAGANEESSAKNEEWRNFLSLTSGVDDILKKTQDDLSRIKSTSFFQRIPTASETQKKKQSEPSRSEYHPPKQEVSSVPKEEEPSQLGIVQISESETEEEEDDDIFDTAYIDAIATGEVKLAYIPDSPTEKADEDDPFDTSIAERAILGPAVERKGKKLVPLGAAVEVLTGRVQLPTCATKPVSSRRQIIKHRDLLGSFDNVTEPSDRPTDAVASCPDRVKTLLDDDEIPLANEPIDLTRNIYIPPQPVVNQLNQRQTTQQDILKQFEDDEDKEFEALAAESLSKSSASVGTRAVLTKPVIPGGAVQNAGDWKPFEKEDEFQTEDFEKDPFDTTFAKNILPGKAELKLLEKEILDNDVDFDPRAPERCKQLETCVILRDRVPESELNFITPVHRDLLGGSTSDLSKLGDKPIQPTEETNLENIKYCDPFDTSIVDSVKAPGQAELKFLENELLGDIKPRVPVASAKVLKSISIDDDSFNPRALEAQKPKARTFSRPDVLNVGQGKTVSFTVPSSQKDLLGAEDTSKIVKPLTPFYVRKNSVPGTEIPEDLTSDDQDPFDTSFVPSTAPGKAELKQIESELFNPSIGNTLSLVDPDFDPRDDSKVVKFAAVEAIKEITKPKVKPLILPVQKEPVDLLAASHDISAKVLTPAAEVTSSLGGDTLSYADPFDTSIAKNVAPGKAELRLLENELMQPGLTGDIYLEQNKDLLVHSGDTIIEKPLSPELRESFDIEPDDFDPFDTSIANNIQPGRAELKVLESELI